MDPIKKKARDASKLASILGISLPTNVPLTSTKEEVENRSREAEAVLDYVKNNNKYKKVACKHCGTIFAVNRANVSYCSDRCRAISLEECGLSWDWTRPAHLKWQVLYPNDPGEPLVVSGKALEVADEVLETRNITQDIQEQNVVLTQIDDIDNLINDVLG